jgi:hypothetical protein
MKKQTKQTPAYNQPETKAEKTELEKLQGAVEVIKQQLEVIETLQVKTYDISPLRCENFAKAVRLELRNKFKM